MPDSVIAALAIEQNAPVISDNSHFNKINKLNIVRIIKLK